MKTNKKHFELFKKEVLRWLDIFKIGGWEWHFKIDEEDKENLSESKWDMVGRHCTFSLSRNWDSTVIPLNDEQIKKTALHEVLHTVFARMTILANSRFIDKSELEEAQEEAVNTLINYILKQ